MAEYDSIGGGATGTVSGAAMGAMAGAALGPVGIGVGALLGGLFGSKKTKVPKPPSYSQMMQTNLSAQQGIQDKLLYLEGQYRPQYQGLQEQTLNTQLYGGNGTQGYISMLNNANAALAGVQANAANTYMGTLGGLTSNARNMLLSPEAAQMQRQMMLQAQDQINAGTGLTADDQRHATQSANAAMAARGLTGRQGIGASVLANYNLGLQRQQQARQFASGILSQDSSLQAAALNMGQGAMNQYNAGGVFMGQANTVLGQYQPQVFQPESQMGGMAQGMQYNQQMGVARAGMQQQQGMLQALGAFGSFAAGGGFNGIGNIFGGGTPSIVANPNQYSAPIGPQMPTGGLL